MSQAPALEQNMNAGFAHTTITLDNMNHRFESLHQGKGENSFFRYPDELNKKRLATVLSIDGALYAASIYGLNDLWYKNYPRSSFHFFNDSREWMQMDKLAHMKAAGFLSSFCYYPFRWSGIEKRKAALYGGALSFAYMTTIEILDGCSEHWGFSVADMTANLLGTAIFVSQEIFLGDRSLKLKMSYHHTDFAKYRPDVLGGNVIERILKDYNGQTQWLSVSSGLMFPNQPKIPKWLCISVGYGAEGMLGGFHNPDFNEKGEALPHFERYRQFYLSFDVDFAQVKTNKKWVRALLLAVNVLKVPFPTLEYNTKGQFKFHYLYF